MKRKEFVITILFILINLIVFSFFPTDNKIQKLIAVIIFFICIPLLYQKIVLKKTFSSIGIQKGNWKKGLIFSGGSLVVVALILWLLAKYSDFLKYYFIPQAVVEKFQTFIIYEIFGVLLLVVVYEFFFRGFVMHNIETKIKYCPGFIFQALLFFVFMWATNTSLWLIAPYLVFAPFAGYIAHKSNSIFYSGATQFLIIFIFDANIIRMIK